MKKKKKNTLTQRKKFFIPSCKKFNGYKPCAPGLICHTGCEEMIPVGKKILIINLDAMGAVLQTTAMLPAVKRKYPESHLSWITEKNACRLLDNNPFIDRVYVWDEESRMILQQMKFDIVYSTDKTRRSCAFARTLETKKLIGFGMNGDGAIIPLNKEAEYSYRLGLDDDLKFRKNEKPGTEILQQSMGLKYRRDPYILTLSPDEEQFCHAYKKIHHLDDGLPVVGFNTGCSYLFPNKKMTVDQHEILIRRLAEKKNVHLVLVGGPEDTDRNAEIVRRVGGTVHSTPTTDGVRRGLCFENICDLIISGDSFGMHAAIGLKKHVVAWFGLSCWSEIDLYDRGNKIIPHNLPCAPCWKRICPFNLECIAGIDLEAIIAEVDRFIGEFGK